MVQSALLPWLEKEYGLHRPVCHLKLRFVGIGQSLIDQTLRERAPPPADALISSEFEGSRVDFTFSLREDSEANRARLRVFADEVRKQLGPSLYAEGDITLEQLAARRMQAEAAKVVLAEAAPFGALATALGRSSETRTVVQGAYQAPSEEGLRRLLGISDERWDNCRTAEERATALAETARAATGAAWVIAVGEARNASTASPAVCVALLMGGRPVQLWRVALPESAEAGRANLVTEVMDRIRRIP
jgi:nicotinamide-nucleotide amidase